MRLRRVLGKIFQVVGALTVAGLILGLAALFLAGHWLSKGDEPAPADYIVCLSGDDQRLLYTADLYAQGLAPAILISRPKSSRPGNPRLQAILAELGFPQYDTETFRTLFLQEAGVPAQAIHFYGRDVLSTVEEAEALRDFLHGEKVKLLVVTSPYHVFRAGMVFRDVLQDCQVLAVSNPEDYFVKRWWTDQYSAMQVVLETAKLAHYLVGGVFRSTDGSPENSGQRDPVPATP